MLDALCLDLAEKPTYNSLINAMVDSLYTDDYLGRHNDKIKEFENLLISFMHDELKVKETDYVENLEESIEKTLNFFEQQRPRICNIIMKNVENMLKKYEITFDREIDFMCLVVDRDPDSFKEWQFDEVLNTCEEKGFRFLLSNPNFEFWLLLHFDEVLSLDKEKLLKNEKINPDAKSSVRFLPNELRKQLGKYKKNKFEVEKLVRNIDKAVCNEKDYCENLPDLKNELGCNIGRFIEEIKGIK